MISILNAEIIIWFMSVVFLFTLTTMLLACACCQKPVRKDDLLGLDGMVKITNPDENVNHMTNSANNSCITVNIQPTHNIAHHDTVIENANKSNARPSGGSNSNRSLPDIPRTTEPGIEVTTDTNSEIYATVEDKLAAQPLAENYPDGDYSPRTASISTGIDSTRPSLSQQSSLSQADAPYARLKSEHPYDKLKKEHPYASVQKPESTSEPSNNTRNSQTVDRNSNDVLLTIPHSPVAQRTSISSLICGDIPPPIAPPRSRRSSSHLSLQATSTSDIPAATAVAGRVAASQDLPYMTPPQLQQNFSGDSQDSSKGYTSISVREPLANILAQTQAAGGRTTRRQELSDSHYATVSDDSDEMYAAIEEPNHQIYNSGSETYAQIQPNPGPSISDNQNYNNVDTNVSFKTEDNVDSGGKSPAPQPPSVDSLRQVAHVHSRQASSSSCTSSVANLGSPKPEKRQANSPLPPRPPISPEPRLSTSSIARNLEDMYAKVHKNSKKKSKDNIHEDNNAIRRLSSTADLNNQARNSVHSITEPRQTISSLSGARSWSSRESIPTPHRSSDTDDYLETGYDKPDLSQYKFEHCYEKLNPETKKRNSYEKLNLLQRQLPPVAITNSYDPNSGPESLLSNDPGYEVLHKSSRPPSDCDPNYEVLKPTTSDSKNNNYSNLKRNSISKPLYSSIHKKSSSNHPHPPNDPGYESVKLPTSAINSDESIIIDEPNYESMPNSDCTEEPTYASVAGVKSTGSSETDSNRDDPNYESVKYYRKEDFPLYDNTSSVGYEKINKRTINSDNTEQQTTLYYSNIPGYERVGGANQFGHLDESNSTTGNNLIRHSFPRISLENEALNRRRNSSPQTSSVIHSEHLVRRGSTIIEDGVYKV